MALDRRLGADPAYRMSQRMSSLTQSGHSQTDDQCPLSGAKRTRDDVLDNVTLYWLTNTAISSARLYWDTSHNLTGGFFDARGIKIPVAVSAFAEEIYQAPKSWAEKAYPKLIHYNRFPKGTHFVAWEQTELFVSEMRASFKSLRG